MEITNYIEKAIRKQNLTEDETVRAFQIIMMGGATPAQMAALLVALRMKGETVDELTGAARVMRAKCGKIIAPENAIDTCGTGGDNSGSLNISTAVAFVVAACGVPVAKHGNRAVSSKSGSADVLRALGVNIEAEKDLMEKALAEINICFMMAPKFHSAMRHVAPVRSEISVRTIFNLIGPLSNPADTKYQLLGVFSKNLTNPLANVLQRLGAKHAWVVHGEDGLDELTTTGISHISELKDGIIRDFEIKPEDFGIQRVSIDALSGGDASYNAEEMRKLFRGKGESAYVDIVLLNAAAALFIAGKVNSIEQGIISARESLMNGQANEVLLKLIEITNL